MQNQPQTVRPMQCSDKQPCSIPGFKLNKLYLTNYQQLKNTLPTAVILKLVTSTAKNKKRSHKVPPIGALSTNKTSQKVLASFIPQTTEIYHVHTDTKPKYC